MDIKLSYSYHKVLSIGLVITDVERCVQCGICSYNCPSGIDIRKYVWQNRPIKEARCLACGQCVARCPRGVLRFEVLQVRGKNMAGR